MMPYIAKKSRHNAKVLRYYAKNKYKFHAKSSSIEFRRFLIFIYAKNMDIKTSQEWKTPSFGEACYYPSFVIICSYEVDANQFCSYNIQLLLHTMSIIDCIPHYRYIKA